MAEKKSLVKNASDLKQLKEAKSKEERLQLQLENDLKTVLSTVEGRRFYWNLLCDCGIFKESFTGNSHTFYNEGKRSVGLLHLANVNDICPEAYTLMLKESKEAV